VTSGTDSLLVHLGKESIMKRFTLLAVVAALGLAACATGTAGTLAPRSDGSGTSIDSPAPTNPSPSPANAPKKPKKKASGNDGGASGNDAGSPSKPASCEAVNGGSENHVATLVDVRVGAHEGYDRVTFEFAPPADGKYFGLPLYQLRSATPPITEDGSGAEVDVDGDSFATIVFHGASGVDFTGKSGYEITYDGPQEFRPGYEALIEATRTGDFEATLSWAFGLAEGSCWTVHELDDPLRVAIDFSH
jgi:hypothetical protein